jgi:hypothetical protein
MRGEGDQDCAAGSPKLGLLAASPGKGRLVWSTRVVHSAQIRLPPRVKRRLDQGIETD